VYKVNQGKEWVDLGPVVIWLNGNSEGEGESRCFPDLPAPKR
jgi:hypothetical protein